MIDWRFALFPVFTNSILLTLAAAVYNRSTGKAYPPRQIETLASSDAGRFVDADIDRVPARYTRFSTFPATNCTRCSRPPSAKPTGGALESCRAAT